MKFETYHVTPKTADQKAYEIMDSKQRGLSSEREGHINNLGTNTEGDHLYTHDIPDDEVGVCLEGVLYGHEIYIIQNGSGEFTGTMDGKNITKEQAKTIVDKWASKAMLKKNEDIKIKRAKVLRAEENDLVKFNDDLDQILAA